MSSQRLLLALGGILGGLLLPASTAGADPGHYTARASHATKVKLQGSNGYRVNVSAGDRRMVTVTVRKGGITSQYSVKGAEAGKYGADARLGGLGRVRFRFVPNGRESRVAPPPWCEGPAGRAIHGFVQGRIRFSGEGGYTRVAGKRAKAMVETWPKMRCRYLEPGEGRKAGKFTATFSASRDETLPNVAFTMERYAKHLRPSLRQVVFHAYTGLSRGAVGIFHSASVATDASSFVLLTPKTAPENFKVTPSPPFSGTATFQRTPESVFTWEGDLSIRFPGTAPMTLAGPDFYTNYCALRGCITQDPPEFP